MCGRYNFTITEKELREIIVEIERKYENPEYKTGEVFPTNQMPILVGENDTLTPELKIWGFPWTDREKRKHNTINARIGTAPDKRMFSKSFHERRCVVPTSGFYEWTQDKAKIKYLFRPIGTNVLYLAGLHREYAGQQQYVILTTNPNESVKDIHDRMPVLLQKSELEQWVFDHQFAEIVRQRTPAMELSKIRTESPA